MSFVDKKVAVVFPGQGSQSVGMIKELYDNYEIVRETYEQASQILDFDLWKMTKQGPIEDLNNTINTQPAVLVAGVAAWRAFKQEHGSENINIKYFAGHSLGEYTALVAAGILDFSDAVYLARKRAQLMQEAVPKGVGAMAAIIGLEIEEIRNICQKISTDSSGVWAVNDNSPGQTVIAGNKEAVDKACELLKENGAKRALILPVSVPSHCRLMQSAADNMAKELAQVNLNTPSTPVIHNFDISSHSSSENIKKALVNQLIMPVRWVETINYFGKNDIEAVIEIGPGKILSGLNKRINKGMATTSIFNLKTLKEFA